MDQLNQLEIQVRRKVNELAHEEGVLARSRPPRRASDLSMIFLRGPREKVLGLPLRIFDEFEGYDLEIIRSNGDDKRYLLVLAVTKAIVEQQTQVPERRAKLRRRLQRERTQAPE